jgi:hypothetical protein
MTGFLGGNGVYPKKIEFLIEKPQVPWGVRPKKIEF